MHATYARPNGDQRPLARKLYSPQRMIAESLIRTPREPVNPEIARDLSAYEDVAAVLYVAQATARRVTWSELWAHLLLRRATPSEIEAARGEYDVYCGMFFGEDRP